MQGVITAVVAFIFVCIIFPSLVKNRPQYYAALFLVLLAIFVDAIANVSSGTAFRNVAAVLGALLVIGSVLLLILCAGGLAVRDLASDIGKTIEVVRRGGEKETIIIPRSQKQTKEEDKVYVPGRKPREEIGGGPSDAGSAGTSIPLDE
jgi:hypothetical protein